MERALLARWLVEHRPADEVEAGHVRTVLAALAGPEDPFSRRSFAPGHVTASAFVLSPDARRLLLIEHARLGLWLQPGGHVDPDDRDIVAAARREVAEETGLVDVVLVPGFPFLLDVDVHRIPSHVGRGEPEHLHLDVRVLFQACREEIRAGSDARSAAWIPLEEVAATRTDASVRRAVERIRGWLAGRSVGHAPAADRNTPPLAEVLREEIRPGARVLEVASGTGQHAEALAEALDVAVWQPSDLADEALGSIALRAEGHPRVRPPVRLDAARPPWPAVGDERYDAVVCINMAQVAPWSAMEGLVRGAVRVLAPEGRLIVYGPWRVAGAHTAESNAAFDASLRARDPAFGVRDLERLVSAAGRAGLSWRRTVRMPANNLVVVFGRDGGPADPRIDEVIEAWFGTERPPTEARQHAWWAADPAVDEALRVRFGALHAASARGELDGWAVEARGRLALVLLLDQFSRQLHRHTPGMYACDAAALALALDGLARGMHLELDPFEHLFLLMPLMHAEDRAVQALSVAAFRDLAARGEAMGWPMFATHLDFAERHRVIVDRFGRFPHRNAILGRTSTPEEEAFLKEPGSSF